MDNCRICGCLSEFGTMIADGWNTIVAKGGAGLAGVYAAAIAWLSGLVFSEAVIIKTFLLSVGILIGATFSDFVKKHRAFFVFAALVALSAFLYQVFIAMQDDDEF